MDVCKVRGRVSVGGQLPTEAVQWFGIVRLHNLFGLKIPDHRQNGVDESKLTGKDGDELLQRA